jgi:hypothetical protein
MRWTRKSRLNLAPCSRRTVPRPAPGRYQPESLAPEVEAITTASAGNPVAARSSRARRGLSSWRMNASVEPDVKRERADREYERHHA